MQIASFRCRDYLRRTFWTNGDYWHARLRHRGLGTCIIYTDGQLRLSDSCFHLLEAWKCQGVRRHWCYRPFVFVAVFAHRRFASSFRGSEFNFMRGDSFLICKSHKQAHLYKSTRNARVIIKCYVYNYPSPVMLINFDHSIISTLN